MIKKLNQRGSLLIPIIVMVPFLVLTIMNYMQLNASSYRLAKQDQFNTHAQLAADAGVDFAAQQLVTDGSWPGTPTPVTLSDSQNVRTTYEVNVVDINANTKNIVATGKTYRPSNSTTPKSSVTLTVGMRPVRSGSYSVVTGVGGLIMRNNSRIVNGNVFVNGTLSMSNSAQIGLSILPVNVKVAHQSCPIPATASYPAVCTSGQPITMSGNSRIYGRVEATNQTDGANMSNTGLVANSSVSPVALPDDHDRNAQKAAVAYTRTGADASCSSGTKAWQANTRIDGNVVISGGCTVIIEGNVWVTGNFEMRNSAILKVQEGVSAAPVIMVDGSAGAVLRNSSTILPTISGLVGSRIITYYSTGSCSPDCSTLTGAALYNSQQYTTINLENSASGAQTEFYSRWTKTTAGNAGTIGALSGQTVELTNTISITLGTTVTGFGDTIWVIDSYRRTF